MLKNKIDDIKAYVNQRKKTLLLSFLASFTILILPILFFMPTYEARVALKLGQISKFSVAGGVLISEGIQNTQLVYTAEKEILRKYGKNNSDGAYVRHVENLSSESLEIIFVSNSAEETQSLARRVVTSYLDEDKKRIEIFTDSLKSQTLEIESNKNRLTSMLSKLKKKSNLSSQELLLEVGLLRELRLLNAEKVAIELAASSHYTHAARIIGNPEYQVVNTGGSILLRVFAAMLLSASISLFLLFLLDLPVHIRTNQLKSVANKNV